MLDLVAGYIRLQCKKVQRCASHRLAIVYVLAGTDWLLYMYIYVVPGTDWLLCMFLLEQIGCYVYICCSWSYVCCAGTLSVNVLPEC
jgi:hypothetical protein